ncbi:hypothetical protein GYMLUDRAFT_251273 [Collybiopsis luxurians FD-317 M1]|uniref:Uncharacterized protein n=1 Tax=Collybiopsis luxurians FD-317 M1 TaxID=944289 RepID=A0A0D0APU3_9AGAR|nr:hypothetical protein GYMLUDRAFT_251273 [Collybiopsis luxurians FD-317 M1]
MTRLALRHHPHLSQPSHPSPAFIALFFSSNPSNLVFEVDSSFHVATNREFGNYFWYHIQALGCIFVPSLISEHSRSVPGRLSDFCLTTVYGYTPPHSTRVSHEERCTKLDELHLLKLWLFRISLPSIPSLVHGQLSSLVLVNPNLT